jgi:spore coat polysaccharide biosynthesis predicted glycosyltransferase SpsG
MYFATSSKLRKILLDSDIAISAGGHTLYELLRIGLPTIGICFYKNQLLNLTALNKLRVIDYLGWYNNRNLFRKLKKSINRMSSYRGRITFSRIGQSAIDGKGSLRVAKFLINFSKRIIK